MKTYLHLFILFFLISCSANKSPSKQEKNLNPTRSYLALGDSYTIGESVAEHERWPNQLVKQLNLDGNYFNQPKIIAKTGWRTDELHKAIVDEKIEAKFNLVSLSIGVNNQYQGKSVDEFGKQFIELIDKAISLSETGRKGVFVVSIPDYGVTPFGQTKNPKKIALELAKFNQLSQSICDDMGVLYMDITGISKAAASDLSLVAKDKLHPSAKMYQLWVNKKIFPELKATLPYLMPTN